MADAKAMAYGGNDQNSNPAIYRMQRNTPYSRRGQLVPSYPQFKALYTYTPAPGDSKHPKSLNVQTAFRVGMSYTRVAYPVPALPNPPTGGS